LARSKALAEVVQAHWCRYAF